MTARKKEMTVGDLRKAIEKLPDDMPIVGEYFEERSGCDDAGRSLDDIQGIGGLESVTVESRCSDTPSLFLNINPDVGGGEREDLSSETVIDWHQGTSQHRTLRNDTVYEFADPNWVGNFALTLIQDYVGGHQVTWPEEVKWPSQPPPIMPAASGAKMMFNFWFDGETYFGVFY